MANITPERVRRALAVNVKSRRVKARLSQMKLAGMIGVRQSYISCIESAREGATVDTVARLALALHTQPSRLLRLV